VPGGERLKLLRKETRHTQSSFGEVLGVTRNAINNVELGRVELSDILCKSICREFNVNESWLRTGEGEMFISLNRNQEIAEFIGKLLHGEDDTFKHRLIAMLAGLDEDDWEYLEKKACKLVAGLDEKQG